MNLDISVAPEIALLAAGPGAVADRRAAAPSGPAALPPGAVGQARAVPATVGYLARCLRLLVAEPQAWWDLVRFDPLRPAHVPVPAPGAGCEAWLLVLPPARRADEQQPQWRWDVACLVAGAIAGPAGQRSRPLPCGRIRVRGSREPHHLTNVGRGYAVSLHARRSRPPQSPPERASAADDRQPQCDGDGLAGAVAPVGCGEAVGLAVGECPVPTGPGDVGEASGDEVGVLSGVGEGLARRVVGDDVGVRVGDGDEVGVEVGDESDVPPCDDDPSCDDVEVGVGRTTR